MWGFRQGLIGSMSHGSQQLPDTWSGDSSSPGESAPSALMLDLRPPE